MSQTTHQTSGPFYIGIDFHKHYSVFCVIDARNSVLERGRIENKLPIGFELLLKRYLFLVFIQLKLNVAWWLLETSNPSPKHSPFQNAY